MPTHADFILVLSRALRDIADELIDRAGDAFDEGEITKRELKKIHNEQYIPLIKQSSEILLEADAKLADELDEPLENLARATKNLRDAAKNAKRIGGIVQFGAKLLELATAIAAIVATPSADTVGAALGAVGAAVDALPS